MQAALLGGEDVLDLGSHPGAGGVAAADVGGHRIAALELGDEAATVEQAQLGPVRGTRYRPTRCSPGCCRRAAARAALRRQHGWVTVKRRTKPWGTVDAEVMGWTRRRATGRRWEVRGLYGEGVASHTGPESCAAVREDRGEALTGERVGQPLSGENQLRVPMSSVLQKATRRAS
jgi:hypothetical protein